MPRIAVVAFSVASACAASESPENPPARLQPVVSQTAREHFGAPLHAETRTAPLDAILDRPTQYADKTVRTEGEIARVCQAMGCWMELRSSATQRAVRVPMSNHAFFLPKHVAGRRAVIEGRVFAQVLTDGERAHLEAEGAHETRTALAIEALGVEILD